ncbi:MAG: energy transducer TonB [Desulfobulbales bacterium]
MKFPGAQGFISPFSMFSEQWRKPFNISFGLHIVVLAFAILAPNIFNRTPKLPEIYTVNLYNATEISEQPAPAPAPKSAAKQKIPAIKLEEKKPAVSIQPSKPESAAVIPTTIAEPISLKPQQQKIKIGKTKEEEALDKARVDQIIKRLKAGAAQKEAKAEADKAAKDAVNKLADVLKTNTGTTTEDAVQKTNQASSTTETAAVSGPRGTGIEPDFYLKQYLSAVYQKIHDHWVLPDLQNWDNSLEAVLVITINRNGTVANTFFERKSDNIYFNQFVLKAVKDASPLPPFPDQLKENVFELGLRFKPGELY